MSFYSYFLCGLCLARAEAAAAAAAAAAATAAACGGGIVDGSVLDVDGISQSTSDKEYRDKLVASRNWQEPVSAMMVTSRGSGPIYFPAGTRAPLYGRTL